MSHKVVTLVYSRRLGSAHRKAILAYMADRASDDGRGVFCSKGTIAEETEIARSTVFKTIRDLVSEGVLIEAGSRACKNGATVVYDLNLEAIRDFPEVKSDQSASRTRPPSGPVREVTSPGAGLDQSASRTPTSPGAGPKPSLEPSLNKEAEEEGARATADVDKPVHEPSLVAQIADALGFNDPNGTGWPRYWVAADAPVIAGRWISDLGLTATEVLEVAVANKLAHGSPANGPKTLTRHMQAFAAAKSAPPLEIPSQPTGGLTHDRATARDRRETAADDALQRRLYAAARVD